MIKKYYWKYNIYNLDKLLAAAAPLIIKKYTHITIQN